MSDQRRRRWADLVQMLYKCFVLTVISSSFSPFTSYHDGGRVLFVLLPDQITVIGNEMTV